MSGICRLLRGSEFLVLLFPVSLSAQRDARPDVSTDTIVRLVQQPQHPGLATLVEELSIGVADGAEEYMLGEIADITLGRDGSIYVFDRQVPVIRQYDSQGKFVRTIGRRGQGPGEYRSTSGIATMRDGRLLLWDTGNWRINVYSANGDVLTQWLTPSGSSGNSVSTYSRAILVDTSDRIITRKTIFNFDDIRNRPTVWLRYRSDGTPIDTLQAPAAAREIPQLSATSGRATVTRGVPFSPTRIVTISPLGYLIAGFPDRYAFEIHQPGKPVVSVRRETGTGLSRRTRRGPPRSRRADAADRSHLELEWS